MRTGEEGGGGLRGQERMAWAHIVGWGGRPSGRRAPTAHVQGGCLPSSSGSPHLRGVAVHRVHSLGALPGMVRVCVAGGSKQATTPTQASHVDAERQRIAAATGQCQANVILVDLILCVVCGGGCVGGWR